MKILLVNDDGINAPGLQALRRVLCLDHEVSIVAPATDQSGRGTAITTNTEVKVTPSIYLYPRPTQAWTVEGTPIDCVHYALAKGSLILKPDLVISGINNGHNLGEYTRYSGTYNAAKEAFDHGIPAISCSLQYAGNEDQVQREHNYFNIAEFISDFIEFDYDKDLTHLNINFPVQDEEYDLKRVFWVTLDAKPTTPNIQLIGGNFKRNHPIGKGPDARALSDGHIAITREFSY